jgi:hypothetical protein
VPENYLDSLVSKLPAADGAPVSPDASAPGAGEYLDKVVQALPAVQEPHPEDEQRKYDFLKWRVQNETRDSGEVAEVLRLSAALSWSPEAVAGDLLKARSAVEAQNLDAEKVLKAHPALADFIGDPRTTALARGDTARLTGLAYLTGTVAMTSDRPAVPGAVELWLRQAKLSGEGHDLQLQLMLGTAPEEGAAPPEFDPTGGAASQAMRAMTPSEKASLREQIAKNQEELRRLKTYGDGVEELAWAPRQLARAARTVIEMGPKIAEGAAAAFVGTAAGGPVGATAAATTFWAYDTAPGIFWQLSELKDPHTGKPVLSEDEARNYALAAAVPIGLLNAVGFEGMGATLTKWKVSQPFVEKALSLLAKDSVEKVLAQKGLGGVVERAALHWGTHALQGGLMMATQSGITQAAAEVAAGMHGVDAPGSVGDAFGDGFAQGLADFWLLSAWGPARKALAEHGQIRASRDSAEVLRDLGENTRESKLFQNAPEEGAKLLARMAGDKNVYLDREAFDSFAQEKKVSPRELAAGILGDDGKAYDAASTGNTELAIPLAKWAEKVVLAGHEEKLAPHARLNLDEMTPSRLAKRMKEIANEMQDRADARGPAFEQEVKDLREQLRSVAKDVGHSREQSDGFAETLSRAMASASLRFDVPLREAVLRAGLPQLRLEGRDVLTGKLAEAMKLTEDEKAAGLEQAAWHGSPHDFERFDMNQLGSGVGQSLWAWGLNFAKEKKTADFYRTMLSDDQRGHLYRVEVPEDHALLDYDKKVSEHPAAVRAVAEKALKLAGKDGQDLFGRQVYETLQDELPGGARDASEWFKKEGVPGLRYTLGDAASKSGAENNFVIWDEKHIQSFQKVELAQEKSVKLKMPKNASEKRGTIRFSVDQSGRAHDFDIRALRGDASTLAHETGHFLSWSLHDLATRADAPESVKADYSALLKFGGWDSAEARLSDNAERSKLAALKKPDEAQALKLKELTAKEEKLSHAWETYLGEGKAPNAGMKRLFARYRRWMAETYGNLGGIAEQFKKTYGEDLWLSDEVRGVFSRLLAVDNEVESRRADDARFDVGGVLHLTPEEVSREAELREAKYQGARDGLDRTTASYNAEASKGFLRAEKERIRADVHEELSASSPYVAYDFFKTGELRDGDTGVIFAPSQLAEVFKGKDGKPLRLSYDEAVKDVGADTAKLLKRRGLVSEKKGGVGAGEVAGLFNFKDAKELLESLAGVTDKEAAVEMETTRRFEEAFGPKLHEIADALSAAGNDAMHNPADIQHALFVRDVIAREIGAPAKRGGKLPHRVLDMNAERLISGTRVREVSPKFYLDTERRLASETKELLEKAKKASDAGKREDEPGVDADGKPTVKPGADSLYSDALHKWDSVLMAKLLWRHARDAQHEIDAAEAMLKRAAKTPWAQRLGQADPALALADANDTILASVGMKEDVKAKASSIDAALAVMQRDGVEGVVLGPDGRLESTLWDSGLLRDLAEKPSLWKDLTLAEAREVRDAVENIAKTGRERNKLLIDGKRVALDEFMNAIEETASRLGATNDPRDLKALASLGEAAVSLAKGKPKAPGKPLRTISQFFQNADANLTEIRQHIERLIGGDREHPLYKFLVGEREKARDLENRLTEKLGAEILEKWTKLPKEMRKRATEEVEAREALPLPNTHGILSDKSPMTRSYLWMIALNMGNAGNKQRLLDGFGWKEKDVLDVLGKHLSAEEVTWVQGVWDSLAELYPHVEATHIADTGLRPEKVEAVPFKLRLADGQEVELKGGYFPIRYDPRVAMADNFSEKQAGFSTQVPLTLRPKTAQGYTKARAEQASGLLHLDFDVVPAHVTQVIHDVSHRLWVKQASRIVHDSRFENIVKARLGLEYEPQFRSWVLAIANQYASTAVDTLGKTNRFFSWAKSRATLAAVGFNVAVPLADLTNPLLPVLGGDLSALSLAKTTRQLATRWGEMRAFALENSIELRARKQHGNSLGLDIPGLVKRKGALGEVEHAAYWMMEASDRATATPVWLAKYWEGLDAGATHETAVRDAEATVQKYFPASDMASRAALLRDKGLLGNLAFLYGFGSKLYNLNRATILHAVDAVRDGDKTTYEKSKAVGLAIGVILAQASVVGLTNDFLSGHGPKKNEDKEAWLKERALSFVTYQLPVVQLLLGGRAALPASGLFAKERQERHRILAQFGVVERKPQEKSIGPWESLAALGSMSVAGAGMNQFVRTGQYLDKSAKRDLRLGKYRRFASGLIYGNRDIITPLNLGE